MADNIRYVGNAVRKENTKKNFKRSLNLTLISALIIIAALIGLNIAEKTAAGSTDTTTESTGAYPISFSSNDIRTVDVMGKNSVVLTKKFVTAIDKRAGIVWEVPVVYGDPAVFTSDKYVVAFDRLSNKYAVITAKGEVSERKAQRTSQIYNACVTDKGEVLLSMKSDSSACLVSVIDKKGNEKFVWSCTEEYIVDMFLSSDSNTLYCAGISAAGGEIYTKVYCINMKNGEEKSYTVPSESCVALNYISSEKFNVITNSGLYVFDGSKEEILLSSTKFSSKLLYYSVSSDGSIAAVTSSTANLSENILTVYTDKAHEKYRVSVQDGIEDIFLDKDTAYLLYSDCVIAAEKGEIDDKLFFENKAVGVIKCAGKVYCYSLGGVEKAKG